MSRSLRPASSPARLRTGAPWAAALAACASLSLPAVAQEDGGDADSEVVERPGGRYDYRGERGESDGIDARFPQDPERVRQLKAIERAVEAADWDRAADALLFVLGEAEGEVVRLSDGASATVVDEASRLLARFPGAERRALNRRLGPAARAAYEEASRTGDAAALREVAVRYPATDAAREARARLAALHLDRGETGLAARLFAGLLDDPTVPEAFFDPPGRRAAAAAAFGLSGQFDRARALWSGLTAAERAALGPAAPPAGPAGGLPAAFTAAPTAVRPGGATPVIQDPLLVPRWSVPIVADPAARATFREAVDRLERAEVALLPTWEPLAVSAAGGDLVLSRTTEGVAAVDAATGAVRWRSRASGLAVGGTTRRFSLYQPSGGRTEAERDPTVASVYREAAFGVLTTDGVRAFLLEADGPAVAAPAFGGRPGSAPGRPVRLAAYRLDTGRLDWEVGGTLRDEPFDLPLAGWRPLGAPTVDGGDLFLVAERVAAEGRRRIALFCLDPVSGRERWNRTVAYSEASIDVDPARAEWGAFCAVAEGVVVVPTTVGWVAGVDRLTREVLWVERVFEPEIGGGRGFGDFRRGAAANVVIPESLDDYWRPGPPLILGRRVIVAPPGEDRLYGLDLISGERLWRPRRRRNWQAAAALLPGRLFRENERTGRPPADAGAFVLVGPSSLAAVSLDDGSNRVWTYTFPPGSGRPSGMPLAAGDRLLVPVTGGGLFTLDAATGERVDVARRADAGGPARGLGALGVSGGRLVSVGAGGLIGFEDRSRLAADLAAADRDAAGDGAGAADPLLILREAELLRTAGRNDDVLAKLGAAVAGTTPGPDGRVAPAGLAGADAERFRALLRATLRDVAIGPPEGPPPAAARQDELLGRLEAQAVTDAERIAAARLRADRQRVRGEPAAAVDTLRALIAGRLDGGSAPARNPLVPAAPDDGPPPPATPPDAPEPDAEVRLSRAVSRQLRTIWENESNPSGREAVDAFAADLLREGGDAIPPTSPAAELLPFHPRVAGALLNWSAEALAAGGADFGPAELTLLRLVDARADTLGGRARELLGSLKESARESAGDDEESTEDDGESDPLRLTLEPLPGDVQVSPPATVATPASVRPFFRSHPLVAAASGTRLDVLDVGPGAEPGTVTARFPLRGDVQNYYLLRGRTAPRPAVADAGGVLFAVTRGAVTALHPQSGRTLWSRLVPGAAPAPGADHGQGAPGAAAETPRTLQRAASLARRTTGKPRGGVIAANAEVVAVLDDRTLTVLDALTGETIWVRRRLDQERPSGLATSTAVLLTPTGRGGGGGLALAARDGGPLPATERALGVAARGLAVAGAGVVHVVAVGGGHVLTSWDPGSDRPLWLKPIDGEARLIVLPGGGPPTAVVVFPDEGDEGDEENAFLLDLRTGAYTPLGGVRAAGASLVVFADPRRVAFVARPNRNSTRNYSIDSLDTTPVGGVLEVFARTGGRLWRANAAGSHVLHEGFDRLPFVPLLTGDPKADPDELSRVELVALDKRTGREVLRTVIPILGELEESVVTPDGAALHLWNTDSPAEEHWRLRVAPPGERVAPPGEEVSVLRPARRARPEAAREPVVEILEAGDALEDRSEKMAEERAENVEEIMRRMRERREAERESRPR